MKKLENKPISVTGFVSGPFIIVVTIPGDSDEETMIIGQPNGFKTVDDAIQYIEINFSGRKIPYLGCEFIISPFWKPETFIQFCSWEE